MAVKRLWLSKLDAATTHYIVRALAKPIVNHDAPLTHAQCLYGLARLGAVQSVEQSLRRQTGSKPTRMVQYVGTLQVTLLEGLDLIATDANGKSDPFCELQLGDQVLSSKVIKRTLAPKWNQSLLFSVPTLDASLHITVKDYDEVQTLPQELAHGVS